MIVRVPYIGLVNLVAEEKIVPELLQDKVTPANLAHEAITILESGRIKENMINKLRMVREKLGKGGASAKAARIAMEMLSDK